MFPLIKNHQKWLILSVISASTAVITTYQRPISTSGEKNMPLQAVENYLFALSWSPTYCQNNPTQKNSPQCNVRYGNRLIVHGLWGQFKQKNNAHIAYCKAETPDIPASVRQKTFPLIPSDSLMTHEWRKHGTCSHDSAAAYFSDIHSAYHRYNVGDYFKNMHIPDQALKNHLRLSSQNIIDHVTKNAPPLTENNIILQCSGRFLKEIRLCLDQKLNPRPCLGQEKKYSCTLKNIDIPFMMTQSNPDQ